MHNNSEETNRWATITPAARKSIHATSETSSEIAEIMVRYGVGSNRNRQNRSHTPQYNQDEDQGVDVVDNVMSKPRQTSPLLIRSPNHKKLQRTNSYTESDDHGEDTSDDSETEPYSSPIRNAVEDTSYQSSLDASNQSNSPYRSLDNAEIQDKSSMKTYLLLLSIVLGAISIYFKFLTLPTSEDKSTQTDHDFDKTFTNNMKLLQEKYNIDSDSILKLNTAIPTIFSKMDAGSIIFVYNNNSNSFNTVQFENFINDVAYTAARYLRNNVHSIQHTTVVSSTLDMLEHEELIRRYHDDVEETGVLLVKEIDRVPSNLAMAFHYYCDEYDPLVKRSAIFFTLNLANCTQVSTDQKLHELIEKCLKKKWTTVPSANMLPLLTRVVDVVIDVTRLF